MYEINKSLARLGCLKDSVGMRIFYMALQSKDIGICTTCCMKLSVIIFYALKKYSIIRFGSLFMNKRSKILRIRPFNMANFSGAGGYIPVFAILGSLITFPATLLLWAGLAYPLKIENGKLNITILKRRLIIILLPVYFLSIILWFFIVRNETSLYGGSIVGFMVFAVLITSIYLFGIFFSIYFPAKYQSKKETLKKGTWFVITLLLALLMGVLSVIISCIVPFMIP